MHTRKETTLVLYLLQPDCSGSACHINKARGSYMNYMIHDMKVTNVSVGKKITDRDVTEKPYNLPSNR